MQKCTGYIFAGLEKVACSFATGGSEGATTCTEHVMFESRLVRRRKYSQREYFLCRWEELILTDSVPVVARLLRFARNRAGNSFNSSQTVPRTFFHRPKLKPPSGGFKMCRWEELNLRP